MSTPIAIIDIGTSKIGCLIVQDGQLLGGAHAPSVGVKSGEIVDPEAAHALIARTVRLALTGLQVPVREAALAVGCGRVAAPVIRAAVKLDPPVVRVADIEKLAISTTVYAERADRRLLHVEHHHFTLDGAVSVGRPLDRFGRFLAAERTVVTADPRPIQRLIAAVEEAGLGVGWLFPAAAAAALAVTTAQERQEGITVLDCGGGMTSYAMYVGGQLVGAGSIAMGGHHVTLDVAERFRVGLEEAERIKQNYGIGIAAHDGVGPACAASGTVGPHAERPPAEDRAERPEVQTRAILQEAILPRIDTLLRLVADRIDAEPFALAGAQRVVMTGGASLLAGFDAEAGARLGRPVQVRRPIGSDVAPAVAGAPWAVIAGAVHAIGDPTFGIRTMANGGLRRASA